MRAFLPIIALTGALTFASVSDASMPQRYSTANRYQSIPRFEKESLVARLQGLNVQGKLHTLFNYTGNFGELVTNQNDITQKTGVTISPISQLTIADYIIQTGLSGEEPVISIKDTKTGTFFSDVGLDGISQKDTYLPLSTTYTPASASIPGHNTLRHINANHTLAIILQDITHRLQ